VILTRDVTFKELLFYDPKEIDTEDEIYEEIGDVIEVYQFPNIQQRHDEHDSDSDSDVSQEDEDEFEDTQESNRDKELRDNDTETLSRATKPILPTPESTPEAEESSLSAAQSKDGHTRTGQHSKRINSDISEENIQEHRRV
ncbi:MAG: hypothetical protein M1840_003363, partial [Geoglossum simile]